MLWLSYHRRLLSLARNGDILTCSQNVALQSLLQATENYVQGINLYGPAGVGKTFLAHNLFHNGMATYFSSFGASRSFETRPNSVVIIDNAPQDRLSARSAIGGKLWSGTKSVVLVTRQPINDAIHRVRLNFTTEDMEKIDGTMRSLFSHLQGNEPEDNSSSRSSVWERLRSLALCKT